MPETNALPKRAHLRKKNYAYGAYHSADGRSATVRLVPQAAHADVVAPAAP